MGGQVYTKPLTGKAIRLFFEIFVPTNIRIEKITLVFDVREIFLGQKKRRYNVHTTGYSRYYLSAKKRVICLQCRASNELGKKEPLS